MKILPPFFFWPNASQWSNMFDARRAKSRPRYLDVLSREVLSEIPRKITAFRARFSWSHDVFYGFFLDFFWTHLRVLIFQTLPRHQPGTFSQFFDFCPLISGCGRNTHDSWHLPVFGRVLRWCLRLNHDKSITICGEHFENTFSNHFHSAHLSKFSGTNRTRNNDEFLRWN